MTLFDLLDREDAQDWFDKAAEHFEARGIVQRLKRQKRGGAG